VLESELIRISDKYGLSVVGPNCLGIINTHAGLNATFGKATPPEGNIAFLSQSGAFALAVIDWTKAANVGFSKVVSLGNKVVLDECDFIEYLAKDDETAVITMYLEDIREGRRFIDVVRQVSNIKPVVVMKSGRTEAGAKAASSHTGSIAGSVEAFSTAFQQAGMVEANSITDLFDFSLTLSRIRGVKGGIAIVTNSGGPGVMAADAIEESGLKLAAFDRRTMEKLRDLHVANFYNPVDVKGDADSEKFGTALGIVSADENVGAIIAILSPTAPIEFDKAGDYVLELNDKTDVGCVKLNVRREAVKETFFEIMHRAEKYTSARRIEGILVQQMIEGWKEVIVGMKRDMHFGPLIMFGLGGIYVEVFKDVSFRIAPLSKDDAIEMIKSVKAYRILRGVRGEPMSDIDSLVDVLLRVSQLSMDFPEILEADLNPIKVFEHGKGCYAIDFKMIMGEKK